MYRILALLPSSNVENFICWTLNGTSAFVMYPVPIEQEAGWAPEPVWMLWRKEKILASAGNRTTVPRTRSS